MNIKQKHYDNVGLAMIIIFLLGMLNMIYLDNSIAGLYTVLVLYAMVLLYMLIMLIIMIVSGVKDLLKWLDNGIKKGR